MKRKTRTITVNEHRYVWRCKFGTNAAAVVISPTNDKTSTVTIDISARTDSDKYNEDHLSADFIEYITMQKENEEYRVKTISPKMTALILNYLPESAFEHRKNNVYNISDLIAGMGYSVKKTETGKYW